MRTSLIILSFLIFQQSVWAQKMPADYFEEAGKFYESKEYDKALDAYQYIIDNHPKSYLYPKAFYNVGCIHFAQKQFDKAIPVFTAILTSNFNEKESLGGGIMDDPYANYRHRACEVLSDIYNERNAYDSALYYFSLSDSAYPYLHFCGNEYAANDVHKALKYADIYKKLGQPKKSIGKLLPAAFIELADNSRVIVELRTLLKNKTGLKSEFDRNVQHFYIVESRTSYGVYRKYYFKFLDYKMRVPDDFVDNEHFDMQKTIKLLKKSLFYKMICQL